MANTSPKRKTQDDVDTQLYWAIPCFVIGLPFTVSFLLMGRRYIAADEEALTSHKGHRATWDRITDVDKSRWKTKGIAVVHFQDENGNQRKITIDDWKYQQQPTKEIMAHVDAKLGTDQQDEEQPQTETTA